MSEQLTRTAEITKLARLLEVPPEELGYLAQIPSDALAAFREKVTDRLFGSDAERLSRVAAASKLIPIPLAAKISQLAFGPLLCAATAGLLEPARASKISAKVPIPFLADIATLMDPRRAAAVIAAVPAPVVVAVGQELIRRDEYVTMGRFVSFLPTASLRAAVRGISSDAAVLRTAFVLEGKDRLDELLEIARDRLAGVIRAAYEEDLWGEALDLLGHIDAGHLAELGDVAAAQDEALLESLVRAAQRMDAWPDLLPVVARMSGESLDRFAALPVVVETDVLRDIVDAALAHDLWLDLLPLSKHLPEAARAIVAQRLAEEDDATLGALAEQAHEAKMWDGMLPIALVFSLDARARLARLPLLQREDVLRATVDTAARHDLWDDVLPLVDALLGPDTPGPVWDTIVEVRDELPPAVREIVRHRAGNLGRGAVVAALDARRRPRPSPGSSSGAS